MKLITKPIQKGTNESKSSFKASALATAVLAGTIALTASGCTAEIKTADGKSIGTVVINGEEAEALASGITINQMNPVDSTEPANVSVPDVFTNETKETENTTEESSEPTVSVENKETEPAATTQETTATATPTATSTPVPTKADTNAKPSLNNIKEGEVIKLTENKNGNFSASGVFGNISVNHTDNSDVAFYYNDHAFIGSVSSVKWSDVYLFKNNGKTFIYIEVVRGCMNNELNIYEVSDTYVKNGGVVRDFCLSIFSNTKSFKGYDGGPSSGYVLAERMFKVSDSGKPVPADNYSYLGTDKVYATKTMTGYIVRDGKATSEKVTIYSGEPVEPKALNEVEYIDFKYGTDIVRVDFTNECCTYYDQNDYRWIFKAVNSMVSPAYAKPSVRFLGEGAVYEFNSADHYRSLWASGKYGDFYIENHGNQSVKITYNTESYILPVDNSVEKLALNRAYLFKSNGVTYIYLNATKGYKTTLYYFVVDGSEVRSYGSDGGLLIRWMKDLKTIACYEINGKNETISISRNYKVGADGRLVIADTKLELAAWVKVKATQDMEGYVVADGKATSEKVTIKAGDIVTPVECDEVDHIDFKDQSGRTIRVDFAPLLNEYYDQNDCRWTYRAIMSLVTPA